MNPQQPEDFAEENADGPVQRPARLGETFAELMTHDPAKQALERARNYAIEQHFFRGAPGRKPKKKRIKRDISNTNPYDKGRDPVAFGGVMKGLVNDMGWKSSRAHGDVLARWIEIAGIDIARHCPAEGFRKGALVLRASSTAWSVQMKMMIPVIQEKIDTLMGPGVVTSIEVLPPRSTIRPQGPRYFKGRGDRDTYG